MGRKKNLHKVFFTTDHLSAEIYAKKAVKRFGGTPEVLSVDPGDDVEVLQSIPGTTVYMASSAIVVGRRIVVTPVRTLYRVW